MEKMSMKPFEGSRSAIAPTGFRCIDVVAAVAQPCWVVPGFRKTPVSERCHWVRESLSAVGAVADGEGRKKPGVRHSARAMEKMSMKPFEDSQSAIAATAMGLPFWMNGLERPIFWLLGEPCPNRIEPNIGQVSL